MLNPAVGQEGQESIGQPPSCKITIPQQHLGHDWLSLTKFEAKTTLIEKISRVANMIISIAALYGVYAIVTGGSGLLVYASYIAVALAVRKIISVVIGHIAYPATIISSDKRERKIIEERGKRNIQTIEGEGFIVRQVAVYKSGIPYIACLITHPDTIETGNWTIHALGNMMTIEANIADLARENFSNRCNTLLMNGPGVSSNDKSLPTRYQMGAGFEAGLQLLEREVKATHMIMRGLSLGGGMLGEAILNHDFIAGQKAGIHYLFISDRTFSRLSTMASAFTRSRIVKLICTLTGTELDGMGAARKLSQLGICQIVIQHCSPDATDSDEVIPDGVSLAYEMHKENIEKDKIFLESEQITHNDLLPGDIKDSLSKHISQFLNDAA